MKIYLVGHKSPDLDAIASTVEYAELLRKLKRYGDAQLIPTRAGDPNKETQYIFDKFGVEIPEPIENFDIQNTDAIILMDHNEESQRRESVVNDQIIETVDHHKININFTSPVRIDVRPLGSTSTIVYEQFETFGIKPSESTLGLILSSIISDTQGLKSSTTTDVDLQYAHKISDELNMDIKDITFEIFKAKSDIEGLTPEEVATKDYKIFKFGEKRVFINQIETVEPEKVLEQKEELVKELENLKTKLGVEQTYLVITDMTKVNSQIIYADEKEKNVLEKAFTTKADDNIANIGPKMSRKKDIAPSIENALK